MKDTTIGAFMTDVPLTIGVDQTLNDAHAMMREHRIRHLPVLQGGKLVGLVSERDLQLIETLKDVDPAEVLVEEAMSQGVYTVPVDAKLQDVALEMWKHKYGSAVVLERGEVVGIFTAVDALRALVTMLQQPRRRAPTKRSTARRSTTPRKKASRR